MQKRVNVISREIRSEPDENGETKVIQSSNMYRVTRRLGEHLVSAGTHFYTTKGRMKSLLNRNAKITRNAPKITKNAPLRKDGNKVIAMVLVNGKKRSWHQRFIAQYL